MTYLIIGFLLGYLVAEVIHVHLKEASLGAKTKEATARSPRTHLHARQVRKVKARKTR
jgi:hypothetical protein